jgi:hypothetical protein
MPMCVLKIMDLGSEGPGTYGATIFPFIVEKQSEVRN